MEMKMKIHMSSKVHTKLVLKITSKNICPTNEILVWLKSIQWWKEQLVSEKRNSNFELQVIVVAACDCIWIQWITFCGSSTIVDSSMNSFKILLLKCSFRSIYGYIHGNPAIQKSIQSFWYILKLTTKRSSIWKKKKQKL